MELDISRPIVSYTFHITHYKNNLLKSPISLEDARCNDLYDEREEIVTYVSTYDMQGQSIKANVGQMK